MLRRKPSRSAMTVASILGKHCLTQQQVAEGARLSLSQVNDLVHTRRNPTTTTVNRLLGYLRQYEPRLRYEDLFA